jgi:hypothetical protein
MAEVTEGSEQVSHFSFPGMKMTVFWDVAPCSLSNVSEMLTASIKHHL